MHVVSLIGLLMVGQAGLSDGAGRPVASVYAVDAETAAIVLGADAAPADAFHTVLEVVSAGRTTYIDAIPTEGGEVVGFVDAATLTGDPEPGVRLWSETDLGWEETEFYAMAAADPPPYSGTPYDPKPGEKMDPTKIPIFRGGATVVPSNAEMPVDKDGNVKIGTSGPSLDTDPESKPVKDRGAHQIVSIPDGLEIIQQGVKNKRHAIVRPTRPMKPEEFKELCGKIVLKKFE